MNPSSLWRCNQTKTNWLQLFCFTDSFWISFYFSRTWDKILSNLILFYVNIPTFLVNSWQHQMFENTFSSVSWRASVTNQSNPRLIWHHNVRIKRDNICNFSRSRLSTCKLDFTFDNEHEGISDSLAAVCVLRVFPCVSIFYTFIPLKNSQEWKF